MTGVGVNDAHALAKAGMSVWLCRGMRLMMPLLWRRLVLVVAMSWHGAYDASALVKAGTGVRGWG